AAQSKLHGDRVRSGCVSPPAQVSDRQPQAPPFLIHAGKRNELASGGQLSRDTLLQLQHPAAARRRTAPPERAGRMDIELRTPLCQRLIDGRDREMTGAPVKVGQVTRLEPLPTPVGDALRELGVEDETTGRREYEAAFGRPERTKVLSDPLQVGSAPAEALRSEVIRHATRLDGGEAAR